MSVHPIVQVKQKLVKQISSVADLRSVDVLYGESSGASRRDQSIIIGPVSGVYEPSYFGGGIQGYDQSWTVEIECRAGAFQRFPSEAEGAVLDLVGSVTEAIADDPTIDGLAVGSFIVNVEVELITEPTPYSARATVQVAVVIRQS